MGEKPQVLRDTISAIRSITRSQAFSASPTSILDWAKGSPILLEWAQTIGQNNIVIDWSAETATIYGSNEIIKQQRGYKTSDWDQDWIAIGDIFANPIILEISSHKILIAKHGTGKWSPVTLADSPSTFARFIEIWCELYYKAFKEKILNDDFEISKEFTDQLSKRINQELGTSINWKGVLLAIDG